MLSWNKFSHKTSRGGIRIGRSYWDANNYTCPFVILRLLDTGLMLENVLLRKRIFIPSRKIVEIEKVKGMISHGYRIKHHAPDLPETIVFWNMCDRALERKIKLWQYHTKRLDHMT